MAASAEGDAASGAGRGDEPIRTLIVDDHALFRRGLEIVLVTEPAIEVVGEAGDGAEAVQRAGESLPDVVLMEIKMPRSSGIEACRSIKDVAPSARIIILTMSDEEEDLFDAIKAGASGYLLKDIPLDQVAEAVRSVHGGQSLISPSMAGKLLTEFASIARRETEESLRGVPGPQLTERGLQVLELARGGSRDRG